ncbi:MAG TPA: sulfur carrier protein ThiS [Candidatus Binatia bacterium]|nr:sulfur carrier protein ThiS [Candidatus Binatia bacterium]
MQILVNGESRALPPEGALAALLAQLELGERRVAVELNGTIVPRSRWNQVSLHDGDRIEIVHAIGGG